LENEFLASSHSTLRIEPSLQKKKIMPKIFLKVIIKIIKFHTNEHIIFYSQISNILDTYNSTIITVIIVLGTFMALLKIEVTTILAPFPVVMSREH